MSRGRWSTSSRPGPDRHAGRRSRLGPEAVKVTQGPDGKLQQQDLGGVRFVPLIGEEGWSDALNVDLDVCPS